MSTEVERMPDPQKLSILDVRYVDEDQLDGYRKEPQAGAFEISSRGKVEIFGGGIAEI